jgi:NAD+ kinase
VHARIIAAPELWRYSPSQVKTVAIVAKPGRPDVAKLAADLHRTLFSRGIEVLIDERAAAAAGHPGNPPADIASRAELVVVLGGDGTLLLAAQILAGREVPILGVNVGSLGFMTEIPVAEMQAMVDRALAGDFKTEPRSKLRVQLVRESRTLLDTEVLNDAVIKVGALAKIIDIEAAMDGVPLTKYKADGIILSTPTGSTAYALSTGGPIVHPTMQAIVITAICPHTLTQRPIVVPATSRLTFDLKATAAEAFLTIDGQSGAPLKAGDRVLVETAKSRLLLIRNPKMDFFSILRTKLHWGER